MSEDFDVAKDVCFVGIGQSPVCYYRIMLPAMALRSDWCGVVGKPPKLRFSTGLVRNEKGEPDSVFPDLTQYKVVVVQQPHGEGWLEAIQKLQERGVKVVFEIDDYVHGIRHVEEHGFRAAFGEEYLEEIEAAMRQCDALIGSTEWITENYSAFNEQTYLCKNGIDLERYKLTVPARSKVNIGWAGGTGHLKAMAPWIKMVGQVMFQREKVNFVTIGENFADGLAPKFGEERCLSVPWAAIEQYPCSMAMVDIALAPVGKGAWWRGKSDLRFLEAGALGIPCVASKRNYPEIEDGVTGFHAVNIIEAGEKMLRLVDDAPLRRRMGERAREYVTQNRSIKVMAEHWRKALADVVNS